jgi:hypothetical protein
MAAEAAPDDDAWLAALVRRSPLLPDATLRRHWQTLIPWLRAQERYTLAGVLLDVEHRCGTAKT